MTPDTPKNENIYSPENVVSREGSPFTPKLLSRIFIFNEAIYYGKSNENLKN